MPLYQNKKRIMEKVKKLFINFIIIISIYSLNILNSNSEEEEIYLKAISDQIQVITKDLKTLEKAVYQKSDLAMSSNSPK